MTQKTHPALIQAEREEARQLSERITLTITEYSAEYDRLWATGLSAEEITIYLKQKANKQLENSQARNRLELQ